MAHFNQDSTLTSADNAERALPAIAKQSRAMELLVNQADAAAPTDCTVLITGESGVGKDVLARYVHYRSRRASQTLISINCGALPETLVESLLFGHEKGAFTGAVKSQEGLLEAADGSTLFLDEVGELPLSMQVKLLRFLEDGMFRRVGSVRDVRVDVRIIAATNKDLERAVHESTFRSDLYYRLNVVAFVVPPLRERREEIPELVESFLTTFRSKFKRSRLHLSHGARRRLQTYNWPGNVRELRNCLERACALSRVDELTEDDFRINEQANLRVISGPVSVDEPRRSSGAVRAIGSEMTLVEIERAHIESILSSCSGNRERAAVLLGISARTLYRKLKEYGSSLGVQEVA